MTKNEELTTWVVIVAAVGWVAYGLLSDNSVTTSEDDSDGSDDSESTGIVGALASIAAVPLAPLSDAWWAITNANTAAGDDSDLPTPVTNVRTN